MSKRSPFKHFHSSPEVIRLTVMMYVRYPLSLRQVEDLLFERRIDICHETVRFWWNRFGPSFATAIRKRRAQNRFYSRWRWIRRKILMLPSCSRSGSKTALQAARRPRLGTLENQLFSTKPSDEMLY
jgi:hypothetical protein